MHDLILMYFNVTAPGNIATAMMYKFDLFPVTDIVLLPFNLAQTSHASLKSWYHEYFSVKVYVTLFLRFPILIKTEY